MNNRLAKVVLVAGLLGGIIVLAEATQNRADPVRAASTTVEWNVTTKDVDVELAAAGLWAVCRNTIDGQGDHAPIATDAGLSRFAVTVSPGLGEHARRRLRGCLEDATIDRISGQGVTFTDSPVREAAQD